MNLRGRVKNDLIARVDELKIKMIRRLNIWFSPTAIKKTKKKGNEFVVL
jgi:hypothetical protein